MKALIDADSLLYKCGFTFEEKTDWNEIDLKIGDTTESDISYVSNLVEAKNAIDGLIENIKFKTGCDSIELWLTGKGNFRHTIVDDYKHNRVGARKPTDYDKLWDYLINQYKANIAEGYEADDMVVYLKTTYPDDYFLCAIDKDVIYQTEGSHYNYNSDELIEVKYNDTIRFFYSQILTGDVVDGYKGVVGIGKVKASKILDEAEEIFNSSQSTTTLEDCYFDACVEACVDKMKLNEEKAKEYVIKQGQLASMHQLKIDPSSGKLCINLWKS